jgi:hypothetical protein
LREVEEKKREREEKKRKKWSFRKYFKIIFLREKIRFKKELSKKLGTQGEHNQVTGLSRVSVGSVSARAR